MKSTRTIVRSIIAALFLSLSGFAVLPIRAQELDGRLTIESFPVGYEPKGLTFDGVNVWIVNLGDETVTKLRASDGAELPQGIVFDGANIWTADSYLYTLTKLRASDGELLGTFPTGENPAALAFDGGNIWVTNYFDDNVWRIRAKNGRHRGTIAVG